MSNLKEGQVFKNWKEVCSHFGWKETGGDYKEARVKLFSTMYKWHKKGNKIIIDEVYGNNGYEIRVGKKRLISDEFYKKFNTSGVYILSDKFDKKYIGSSKNVYERFIEHRKKDEGSRSTQLDKDSIKIEMIDITMGIEDIEFLCELKKIAIEEFVKADVDLVNRITGVEKREGYKREI